MIDTAPPQMAEQQEPRRPSEMLMLRCVRCQGALARVHLTVGSYIEQRCHHQIKGPDGKRVTCGWVTKVWPTR